MHHFRNWCTLVFMYELFRGNNIFKSFCSGNIISERRVLTSAHCFISNRKRVIHKLVNIRIVAGTLKVMLDKLSIENENQQWRTIIKIYSQKFFRFPAYSLAILKVNTPWIFNENVNMIPYATKDLNFDGICSATALRTMTSWASSKVLYIEDMRIIPKHDCEIILQRSCRLYYCTAYDKKNALAAAETEGGGLICHGSGDPAEIDNRGILVGVTTLINIHLPTLHNRVGLFSQWIKDAASTIHFNRTLLITAVYVLLNSMF